MSEANKLEAPEAKKINFSKSDGFIPVVVQDYISGVVLMIGVQDLAAYQETLKGGDVVFYSRTKKRLWKKGETSGATLKVKSISLDCDGDALLIQATPSGPTCHTGEKSCFGEAALMSNFLYQLEKIIAGRVEDIDQNVQSSYVRDLVSSGISRVAQKIGEEGVESAIATLVEDKNKLKEEVADLFFHTMIALNQREVKLDEIIECLYGRNSETLK
jgi:phosphoribosyl-ATP pyrophosphohydrolase/phosphoribosyl-AMP cyclohydrolase